jgi:hypothetical protein
MFAPVELYTTEHVQYLDGATTKKLKNKKIKYFEILYTAYD